MSVTAPATKVFGEVTTIEVPDVETTVAAPVPKFPAPAVAKTLLPLITLVDGRSANPVIVTLYGPLPLGVPTVPDAS